jgi:hypothetical protein
LLRCPGNQADLTTLIRGAAGRFARDRAAALRGALGRFHRPQHFDGGCIIGRRFETPHAYRKFKRSVVSIGECNTSDLIMDEEVRAWQRKQEQGCLQSLL